MPFETDKNNGFKLDASELLKTGVYPEAFDRRIPFWETVDGVQYTEFGMKRKAGREEKHDFTASPQSSTTPIRGIVATREYGDKVAYIGDLDNIYSYSLSNEQVNTVGTGYNLVPDSSGTLWADAGTVAGIIAASHSGANTVTVTITSVPTQTVGDSITVSGLIFDPANGQDPNITTTITNVSTFLGYVFVTYAVTGSTPETYTTTGGSKYVNNGVEATWDDGDTNWDENVNQADQWDFESYGKFVVGANGSSKPVIKKNNVNFNTYYNDQISGGTVTSGGTSGYSVNDSLTQASVSPSGGTGFTCDVLSVSAGVVTEVEITNFGLNYSDGDVITMNVPGGASGAVQITITVPEIDFDTVQAFHKQGPHLLAFNYSKGATDYSTSFAWCSADDLDTWTAAATNTAGSLLIREANTPIVAVKQLGSSLAAYTENQMFIINYVGQPNIFGYRVALEGSVGAISANSIISVGRVNYGLSRDGFFYTDGATVRMIGRESGMNEFFRNNASLTELGQVAGFDNSKENEVVWGVPINSNKISKEIYYNYKTNQWGMRDSNITAYLDRGIFNESLSGSQDSKFYFEGIVPRLEDANVSAITKAHDLNNADRIKELTAMRVGKEGNGSPTISVGFSSTIDADATYNDTFVVDASFKSFPLRTAGRYIHLKVESDGENDDWTITDLVIQGRFEGER